MKKQQQWWLLFKVFSSSSSSSTSSYIDRPFCSTTTTNTSLLFSAVKKNLPLLIVPYYDDQKIADLQKMKETIENVPYWDKKKIADLQKKKKMKETIESYLYSSVCCDTLGFTSLFDDVDDDVDVDLQKKKKKALVHKLYLPEIANRRICGSSEGWLVTVHENGEIQLLNPYSKVLVHLPPLTAFPQVVGKFDTEEIVGVPVVPINTRGLCYLVDEHEALSSIFGAAFSSSPTSQSFFVMHGCHHFREAFLGKVVTTTTTTDANSTTTTTAVPILPTGVMAIYGFFKKLAFCRPSTGIDDDEQNNKWILPLEGDQGGWEDVTFYKGNFYAVSRSHGHVSVVKGLDGPSPTPFVENIIQVPYLDQSTSMRYLVESSSSSSSSGGGDLVMVISTSMKYLVESFSSSSGGGSGGDLLIVIRAAETKADVEDKGPYRTIGFRVFKLDFNKQTPSWVEVTNLGEDCALFVGHNHSFSFSASKFPGGCRGNCIYFTDNQSELMIHHFPRGGHDIGVYNLEDSSVEKLNYETSPSQLFMPPPIWYVPN